MFDIWVIALRFDNLLNNSKSWIGQVARVAANAKFEMALLCLLLLTAGAIVWKGGLLERTLHFTPATTAGASHLVFSDGDTDGRSVVQDRGGLAWTCDLRAGNAYPYCGYELFLDHDKGIHGLNLTNMHSFAVTMLYSGASTSFRVHLLMNPLIQMIPKVRFRS